MISRKAEWMRQFMHQRDAEAKVKHEAVYGPAIDPEAISVDAEVMHSISVVNKELYGLDYAEFRLNANRLYPYQLGDVVGDTMPRTPLEEAFYAGSFFHLAPIFRAVHVPLFSYDSAMQNAGISKKEWHAEIAPKVLAIAKEALRRRLVFAAAIRDSSASSTYIKVMFAIAKGGKCVNDFICPDYDCFEDCWSCLRCLFCLPFQLTALIIMLPFSLMAFLLPSFLAAIVDLLRCYRCRVDLAMKMAAVEAAMQAHPECENKAVNEFIKTEVEKLANELNNKYPTLRVNARMVPVFTPGKYFQVFEPAHTEIHWRLEFYNNSSNIPTKPLNTIVPL